MDLQTTFYVVGIIFMSLMLMLLVALVVAVFVIRAKVNAIHDSISAKLNTVTGITDKGMNVVDKLKRAASRS